MTKKQLENARWMYNALERMGFQADEVDALLRIERTLHRWSERECNGEIERSEGDGKPFILHPDGTNGEFVADRERGALKRLAVIMAKHPDHVAYNQGDPRGCALYIVRKSDIPEGADIGGYYSRGVAVCY